MRVTGCFERNGNGVRIDVLPLQGETSSPHPARPPLLVSRVEALILPSMRSGISCLDIYQRPVHEMRKLKYDLGGAISLQT